MFHPFCGDHLINMYRFRHLELECRNVWNCVNLLALSDLSHELSLQEHFRDLSLYQQMRWLASSPRLYFLAFKRGDWRTDDADPGDKTDDFSLL